MTTAAAVQPERVAATVEASLARGACEVRELTIAGLGIDMAAEEAIAPFVLTPFAHLRAREPREVALRVQVASMRAPLEDVPDTGVVLASGATVVHLHPHAAAVLDREAGTLHALLCTANGVASWQRAKPLQLPLSIFFADRNIDLLHGGLVSLRGNGVLIAGAGGSGKSTLSIAALRAGADFLGDDCVAVDASLRGHSVFGSGSLVSGEDDKSVLPLAQLYAERMAVSASIRAIVLPRITHGDSVSLQRASGRDALLALAPGSILKRAVPAAGALARMTRMARELPAYRLEMGPIEAAGARIRELLEELA
jgi:hypothetical protein